MHTMHMRRILGLIIILTAILGVVISVAGVVAGRRALERLGDELDAGLTTAVETLDNLENTLELSQSTVEAVIGSMDTLEQTALDASEAIDDTRPLITGASELVTVDVADALESVQQTISGLVGLAATIDRTLMALSQFRVEEDVLGVPITIDPGIEYDPDIPLPEAVNAISDSLAGIPEKLRAFSGEIAISDSNLETIGQDLALISGDIQEMKTSLEALPPLISSFQDNVAVANAQVVDIQSELSSNWRLIRTGLVIFFIWLGLTQIAPLVRGYEMYSQQSPTRAPAPARVENAVPPKDKAAEEDASASEDEGADDA
jgi:hypothetical protein